MHQPYRKTEMQEIKILQWDWFKIVADETFEFLPHLNGKLLGSVCLLQKERILEKLSINNVSGN